MATLLGLVSDVHATPAPLEAALRLLRDEGATRLICAGDIAGYGDDLDATVALLVDAGVESIHGNHDRWCLARTGEASDATRAYLAALPAVIDDRLEGRHMYCVHASPPRSLMEGIRLLDETGRPLTEALTHWRARLATFEPDLLVVGHTHQLFAERLGEVLVVNPGSTLFNRSCALVELPSLEAHLLPLPGESCRRVWNWRGGWK
ncbi:MAG: metallophosphoesterase family protein [Gammaproteobacteria bacterium]|nr:metallophosphoesterase family protein [Gammaproteobacteria bacterium]